ncbi:MAG: hypothetical protein U9Q06_03275 [Nanoarchaeota archaeon]|nr:hypothetical protein [Nanoarchaeota archaeon]
METIEILSATPEEYLGSGNHSRIPDRGEGCLGDYEFIGLTGIGSDKSLGVARNQAIEELEKSARKKGCEVVVRSDYSFSSWGIEKFMGSFESTKMIVPCYQVLVSGDGMRFIGHK